MPIPTVSIVVPTYNRAATLERALGSISAQTYGDHETIVIDDGSTDDTPALLQRLNAQPALRCVRVAHGGAAAARNQGIALARGRFVAFLDSDDAWTPDKLERQLETQSQSGADVVHCDMLRRLTDGRARLMATPVIERGRVLRNRQLDYQTKGLGIQSVLVEARLLRRVGGFDTSLPALEDLDLLLRLAEVADFAPIHRPLVHYHAGLGVSTARLAVARSRRRLLLKYRDHLGTSNRALAYQYGKIALAYLRAGQPRAARRYARLALRTAPLSPRTVAPAMLPLLGQNRPLRVLLQIEHLIGAD
ncbi:MAG: glycosyltransferase family 2 protein [Erythrobacter sp.]|jgi:glycosyltransferase involved in cell wall biosynthesis|nr:glycosyltransferase family 2 protein [Erythrobacter sp.]